MLYNVVVIGAGGVGKSAITAQFVNGVFIERYDPTIEDSFRKQIDIEGHSCLLEILDTAGSQQFTSMRDLYIKTGHGVLLVYSITSQDSFHEVCSLRDRILLHRENEPFPMVLVGNKCDLEHNRVVTQEMGKSKSQSWSIPFIETSAKTNLNVHEVFDSLARQMLEKFPPQPLDFSSTKKGATSKERRFCLLV